MDDTKKWIDEAMRGRLERAPLPDVLRWLANGDISTGRALELIAPRVLQWHRGFPPKSGMYLVELEDGEHVVTPYTVPGQEGEDTWCDKRHAGWSCLTGSRATVKRWAKVPKSDAILQQPIE